MKKIAICMPCFGRPARTRRAIESILEQTINNWQAYIIGDGCPDFEKLMDENKNLNREDPWHIIAETCGNELIMFNTYMHSGGYGYAIRNFVNGHNDAEFIIYMDNDDTLEKDHFKNYLSGIEGTDNDFVYFDTFKDYNARQMRMDNILRHSEDEIINNCIRHSRCEEGHIGHAEIIVRSSFLKDHPEIQETSEYGHDWGFIKQMIDAGAKFKKADTGMATYNIMGAGELRETDID